MNVYLHIGIDKCGSTSIQSGFYQNREKLKESGVFVPGQDFSKEHGHGVLFQKILGRYPQTEAYDADETARLFLQELGSLSTDRVDTAILTWEGLNFLRKEEITKLEKILEGHSVTLVVYIREQAEIAQSGVLQNIKIPYHGCQSIESVRNNPRFLPGRQRDYFAMLRSWQNLLKPDDIVVRRYDIRSLKNGDTLTDLLSIISEIDPQTLDRNASIAEKNTSIDVPSALVLDAVAPYVGRGSKSYYFLTGILQQEIERNGKGLRYFLSESQVRYIRSHYHDSNQELAAAYLNSKAPLFHTRTEPVCSSNDYYAAKKEAADKLRTVIAETKKLEIDCHKLAAELESNS